MLEREDVKPLLLTRDTVGSPARRPCTCR